MRLLLVTLAAMLVAALICAGVFSLYGVSPVAAYSSMLGGTLGDPVGLSEVARREGLSGLDEKAARRAAERDQAAEHERAAGQDGAAGR